MVSSFMFILFPLTFASHFLILSLFCYRLFTLIFSKILTSCLLLFTIARAEADKARYLHELASYVPPPGYDPKGDAIVSPVNTKGRKGKPEKDVNAPKRNMSAYLLYQNAMREQFKRENPGMVSSSR